ncbi:hypothetical protein ARMGADRAFT_1029725 [Armillaria gallica]|uniref:Uncharacterized protein n=1 Tax=Armillaria gallica TaxID=47427 RepID=A0A2H3DXM1_ARMGA|nr:hypothetical protein ARMGADRAFT_1029725 [Armillaria gallica]
MRRSKEPLGKRRLPEFSLFNSLIYAIERKKSTAMGIFIRRTVILPNKTLSQDGDIWISLILTKTFVEFANLMVLKALEVGITDFPLLLEALGANDGDEERVSMRRLNDVFNWQMIDDRTGEPVLEILLL